MPDSSVGQLETSPEHRILTEPEAKEAAMNGAKVAFRRSPPYLHCAGCGGDGSNWRPYSLDCRGPHPCGWEVVDA